jgi:hypothetical protein
MSGKTWSALEREEAERKIRDTLMERYEGKWQEFEAGAYTRSHYS